MTDKLTPQQAIDMRNSIEEVVVARINETLDRLDAYVDGFLPKPEHASYIAEQDRIDLFFKADRIKFEEGSAAERFERHPSPWVWSTRTCQPFPGRNHFVKDLPGGLELWFRIEFAFRGFAGYTVYNPATESLIPFKRIPEETAQGIFDEFGITSEDVSEICWWVVSEYLPAGPEATSPNFRMLDDLTLALLDDEAFEAFIVESKATINRLLAITIK